MWLCVPRGTISCVPLWGFEWLLLGWRRRWRCTGNIGCIAVSLPMSWSLCMTDVVQIYPTGVQCVVYTVRYSAHTLPERSACFSWTMRYACHVVKTDKGSTRSAATWGECYHCNIPTRRLSGPFLSIWGRAGYSNHGWFLSRQIICQQLHCSASGWWRHILPLYNRIYYRKSRNRIWLYGMHGVL